MKRILGWYEGNFMNPRLAKNVMEVGRTNNRFFRPGVGNWRPANLFYLARAYIKQVVITLKKF